MKNATAVAITLFTLICTLTGFGQNARAEDRPGVDVFLRMKTFPILMPLSLSPDGKRVAYTLQDGKRVGESTDPGSIDERPGSGRYTRGCEVWVAEVNGGHQVRIGDPASSNWGPSWSPDGQSLSFFSDSGGRSRPWVWNRTTGQTRPVAEIRPKFVMEYDVPLWSSDNRSILFRASTNQTKSLASAQSPQSVMVLDSPEDLHPNKDDAQTPADTLPGVADLFSGNLVQIEIATGEVHVLTEGEQIYGYWPSPGNLRVAFTRAIGYEEGFTDWTLFDIVVKDLRSGQEMTVAHRALLDNSGTAVSWSPDGSQLAYGTLVHDKGTRYWIWDSNQGSRQIGDAPKLSYPHYPLWNANADRLYISSHDALYVFGTSDRTSKVIQPPDHLKIVAVFGSQRERLLWSDQRDGDAIYIAEQNPEDMDIEIHRAHLSSGSDDKLTKIPAAMALLPMEVMECARDGGVLVFPMESPAVPQDVWAVASGFTGLRQLTHVNPELEQYKFPERRVVRWLDFDGHELRGTLVLPHGYSADRRYPLIVDLYGGEPESRWGKQFSATSSEGVENMQMYAMHGFAAFVPDTFMGTETPMLDLYKSLIPGIEKVIAMGVADENAIGIIGHSYGAYSVYSLLVQTNRFRAGVALSGSGNLITNYGEMDPSGFPMSIAWAEKSQGRMGDTPWKVRDKYIENSPFFYLDRVQTPVLIAHGDGDWHPAYEDREMFVGLRRLGKTAEYAEYRGGGHRIAGWRYADQLDLGTRVLAWFNKYLRPSNQSTSPKEESAQRSTTGK